MVSDVDSLFHRYYGRRNALFKKFAFDHCMHGFIKYLKTKMYNNFILLFLALFPLPQFAALVKW